MSVARTEIEADIRNYVGESGATNEDDRRWDPADINSAIQKGVNRIFADNPDYLYDTGFVYEPPTIELADRNIPVTATGRVALGHLATYFMLIEDQEDANNLAVANEHMRIYMRELSR